MLSSLNFDSSNFYKSMTICATEKKYFRMCSNLKVENWANRSQKKTGPWNEIEWSSLDCIQIDVWRKKKKSSFIYEAVKEEEDDWISSDFLVFVSISKERNRNRNKA